MKDRSFELQDATYGQKITGSDNMKDNINKTLNQNIIWKEDKQ